MNQPKHFATVEAPAWGSVAFLVLLVLKLTGVISWSWWWVTAPLWGGVALSLAIMVVFVTVMLGIWFYESWRNP